MKRKIIIALTVFSSLLAVTYALGTWNTGYRATNGGSTTADTNAGTLFDNIVVTNNYGSDLFVPTKTSAEWVSMWENTPNNVSIRTSKEQFSSHTIAPSVHRYLVSNEAGCDNGGSNQTTSNNWRSGSHRSYHIVQIDAPQQMTGYLNMRVDFGPSHQNEEGIRVFYDLPGGMNITPTHLHEIYKDSGSGTNGPDLNVDNSGGNDVGYVDMPDQNGSGGDVWLDVKIPQLITLKAGMNYFRFEGRKNNGFACESGEYTSNLQSYGWDDGEGEIWFSNN